MDLPASDQEILTLSSLAGRDAGGHAGAERGGGDVGRGVSPA